MKISWIPPSDYPTLEISRNIMYVDSVSGIRVNVKLVLGCFIPGDFVNMVRAGVMVAVGHFDPVVDPDTRMGILLPPGVDVWHILRLQDYR
jgi:hypothetical protein